MSSALTPSMQRLVEELKKLPGIGEKTATRLAFFTLREEHGFAASLAAALLDVKEQSRFCSMCFGLTETDPCGVCADPRRLRYEVCVVEEPADMMAFEKAREYRGLYHVLGGVLSPLEGVGPEHLRCAELVERARSGEVREVIVATNPSAEGEATALWISRSLKSEVNIRVTRIAMGLPMGGDVEYSDAMTLSRSLSGRRDM